MKLLLTNKCRSLSASREPTDDHFPLLSFFPNVSDVREIIPIIYIARKACPDCALKGEAYRAGKHHESSEVAANVFATIVIQRLSSGPYSAFPIALVLRSSHF